MSDSDVKNRPVLVTTQHRGVFFGYEESRDGTTIILKRARNCVRWSGTRGFVGLAADGPNDNCRIGPPAERLELLNITSIADVNVHPAEMERRTLVDCRAHR